MSMLKIALLQIAPGLTLEENLQKGLSACRQAHQMGADIALFPEMWSNGYRIYGRPVPEWTAEAIPADGPFVSAFGSLAQELGMAIGVTLLERGPARAAQYAGPFRPVWPACFDLRQSAHLRL